MDSPEGDFYEVPRTQTRWVGNAEAIGAIPAGQILIIHEVQEDDYASLLALMEQYRDRPMDLADAPIVLVAEKTGYRRILTLDSDFLFYRIDDHESFEVIQVE